MPNYILMVQINLLDNDILVIKFVRIEPDLDLSLGNLLLERIATTY